MSETPPAAAALKDRLQQAFRYRWPVVPALLAALAVALAGLAIPVSPTAGGIEPASRGDLGPSSPDIAAEDLTGFLGIRRWGAPAVQEEAKPAPEPAEPPGLNPALQGIGFVAVTFTEGEYAVWLNLSAATRQRLQDAQPELETGMVRRLAGDTLPDGRRLVAVTADSLTLATAGGEEERHLLFVGWDESPE